LFRKGHAMAERPGHCDVTLRPVTSRPKRFRDRGCGFLSFGSSRCGTVGWLLVAPVPGYRSTFLRIADSSCPTAHWGTRSSFPVRQKEGHLPAPAPVRPFLRLPSVGTRRVASSSSSLYLLTALHAFYYAIEAALAWPWCAPWSTSRRAPRLRIRTDRLPATRILPLPHRAPDRLLSAILPRTRRRSSRSTGILPIRWNP